MTKLALPDDDATRIMDKELRRLAELNTGNKDIARLWEERRAAVDLTSYYHGGYPGLRAGGILQPADDTGYVSFRRVVADMNITGLIPDRTGDHSNVYITHNVRLAKDHAAGWSNWHYLQTGQREAGAVYRVIPLGLVIPDCVYPVCCCLTGHDLDNPCCAKTKSAMVSFVLQAEVWPIVSPGWDSFLGTMSLVYKRWRQVNSNEG
jgi:hypothetical protein